MLNRADIQKQIDKYFIAKHKNGGTQYVFVFTTKLTLKIEFDNFFNTNYLDDEISKIDLNIYAINKFYSMNSNSVFSLKNRFEITELWQIEPLFLLKTMVGSYGFDSGREVDETYKYFYNNNIYCGKNNPIDFIKSVHLDSEEIGSFDRELNHCIELPSSHNHQLILYLRTSKNSSFIDLFLYLTSMNDYGAYLGSNVKKINLIKDDFNLLCALNSLDVSWEEEMDSAISYAKRILTIDDILKEL